jgi:hypothetical protein
MNSQSHEEGTDSSSNTHAALRHNCLAWPTGSVLWEIAPWTQGRVVAWQPASCEAVLGPGPLAPPEGTTWVSATAGGHLSSAAPDTPPLGQETSWGHHSSCPSLYLLLRGLH